ncbi:MAG: Gfo/Idh/MocA family oxidoreductase, partial [Puniceicoccales bacterium]|nr:Gfo/Idh/MocA family oxidoreductase [Puniceicoccales bacterium]
PWLVPAGVVRAQNGRPTPANRTTFALIGSGGMGRSGMGDVLRCPLAQVIAVCDVNTGRSRIGKDMVNKHYKNADCAVFRDFRELLARKDLDCVEVATGDYWHIPIALAAVRAGKDIYVEKPLGVAVHWAQVLRDEVAKRKAVFQFGTWQRSRKHFRNVIERVRAGVIGKVRHIDIWSPALDMGSVMNPKSNTRKMHKDLTPAPVPKELDYEFWQGPAPRRPFVATHLRPDMIYHHSRYAIGYIAGWGIHPVDIAQWGLDADNTAPVSYKGTGKWADEGNFDTTVQWDVALRYESGVTARYGDHASLIGDVRKYLSKQTRRIGGDGTTFFGDRGWLSVGRSHAAASDPALLKAPVPEHANPVLVSDNQWHNFIERVRDRKPTINPISSGFNGDVVCHLSEIAARTGREIKWCPKDEKILNDAAATAMLDKPLHGGWTL